MRINVNQNPETTELGSEIIFLKEEIDFLLKILRNGYSSSLKLDKIKQLDSFWNGFEQNIKELNLLFTKIQEEKPGLAADYHDRLIDSENNYFNRNILYLEYKTINKNIRI